MSVSTGVVRDVNVRFENTGFVEHIWCIAPEDQHDQAVREMLALACVLDVQQSPYKPTRQQPDVRIHQNGTAACWHGQMYSE